MECSRSLRCAALLALLVVGCGEDAAPPTSLPRVDSLLPPFPSDLFTVADDKTATGLRVDLEQVRTPLLEPILSFPVWEPGAVARWLSTVDGFSTFAPIFWIEPAAIEPSSLPTASASAGAGSPLFLVELRSGKRVPITIRHDRIRDEKLGAINLLQLSPTIPLQPATAHAVVMTRALKDSDGEPVTPAVFYEVLRGARRLADQSPMRAAMERAASRAAPLWRYLESIGLRQDQVAQAFVFTTQSSPGLLQSVRRELRAASAPPLNLTFTASSAPADFPAIPAGAGDLSGLGAIVTGAFDSPDFRNAEGDVASPPATGKTLRVPFLLALPASGKSGASRVVILQHGNSGRKELALHVAPALAARGLATAAIDHMGHGELAGTGMFLNVVELARMRGNFAQTIANGLRLVQALESMGSIPALGETYALAASSGVGYLGESLGGMSGVGLAGVEPEVKSAVFNVAGGALASTLGGSVLALIDNDKLLLKVGFTVLLQTFLDRVDPITFAAVLHARPADQATPALMQNVASDNLGTATVEVLARALGATYVCPCPAEVPMTGLPRTSAPASPPGLFYYGAGKHGFLLGEGSDPKASQAVRLQAAHFLATSFEGAARIVDPFLP